MNYQAEILGCHEALMKAGVQHGYFEVEGLDHNQKKMIDGRKAT